jgi:hypothetical protein
MSLLRDQFLKEVQSKHKGIDLMFRSSNQNYIQWLERKVEQAHEVIVEPCIPKEKH